MKKMTTTLCLTVVLLLGFAGKSFALNFYGFTVSHLNRVSVTLAFDDLNKLGLFSCILYNDREQPIDKFTGSINGVETVTHYGLWLTSSHKIAAIHCKEVLL